MTTNTSSASGDPRHAASARRRALITGGTSGLGLALVRELAARGWALAFVARDAHRVEQVSRETGAIGIAADVARKDDIHRIALQALAQLGGLDVLVNNASSLGPVPLRPLSDTDCESLEEAIATNVLGPFRLTRAVMGALQRSAREGRRPVVVNVASDAATTPYPRWGAYGASKAALVQLSRIWAAELEASGVRVLAPDPGDMDTPMHRAAVPDADAASLKSPEVAARELIGSIER